MTTGSGRWVLGLWPRRRPVVIDVALIVTFSALALIPRGQDVAGSWGATAVALVSCVVIVGRHRFPVTTLWTAGIAAVLTTLSSDDGVGVLPFTIVVGSVIAVGLRRTGIVATAAALVALETGLLMRGGDNNFEYAATPLVLALGVAVGLAIDYRRRGIEAVEERIRKAAEAQEADARRAVAEERIRIARELHDVVAHHVAVVGVQAGTAEHLLEIDPEAARSAIVQVRESSGTVLRELATLLELLRGTDGATRAPAPSLARLDELTQSIRDSGLDVEVTIVGEPRPLAPVVDMAAYRLVQESLTNAHKHGRGSAALRVEYGSEALLVDVRNPVTSRSPDAEHGFGLIGMGERAAAVGGTLRTGVNGDEFRVHAELPALTIRDGQ